MDRKQVLKQYLAGWLKLGAKKLLLSVVGWFYVPILLARGVDMDAQAIWGNWEGIEASHSASRWKRYVWYAWRNPCHNLVTELMPKFDQFDNIHEMVKAMPGDPMEQPGFWWRVRVSKDTRFASLRISFGPAMPNGKREFYAGHKVRNKGLVMGFTFFQLRLAIWAAIKGLFK